MFYQGTTYTAVASGKHSFAVALRNGIVHVYDNVTLQISRTVRHGAVVKLLKYDDTGSILLSAGFRRVRMWVIPEGTQMWEVAVRDPLLAAEFIEENRTLISISSQHKLIKQDVATGAIIEATERRPNVVSDEAEETLPFFRRELRYAEFSAQAAMLATMQRERPIQLSDIEDRYDVGMVELEMSDDGDYGITEQPITAMTFCANIDVALLAVAYRDGILAVFDRDIRLIEKRGDNKAVSLLAGSPDGLTLAAASVEGVITLYDFEQLVPLHVLFTSSFENIRSLVFSGDGCRIIDIRDRQANLWAPAALVSRVKEDSDSLSESTLNPTVATSDWTGLKDGIVDITAVVPITNSEQFICGREDGRIAIYSPGDANKEKLLYTVADKQWIGRLVWKAKNQILASVSGTSTVTVFVLGPDWSVKAVLLRHVFLHPVVHLLFQETAECLRMAVVTTRAISLWLAECPLTGQCSLTESRVRTFDNDGLFLEDPPDPSIVSQYVTLVEPDRLRNYSWEDLEEVGSGKHLSFSIPAGRSPTDAVQGGQENIMTFDRATSLSGEGHRILLRSVSSQTTTLSPSASTSTKSSNRKRWILDLTQPNPATIDTLSQPTDTTGAALRANLLPVSHLIEHVIGIRNEGKQLVFLSKTLWVCSYDLVLPSTKARRLSTDHRGGEYTRHFFIPDDWISSNYNNATSQLLFVLGGTKEDCLVFVKKHEIAVIREPFSHAEKIRIT
ncbi:uncharacterized protein Z519_01730 [Cladophialophora bantiana CBS 173.52]|uniref:Anaphase-promoting complex subunit 4 WD40 domain-containing protein n=1 Tax=Cladophialophora bantiana (strain ATCC 10958 / CBS 173.52 / CDC B-1940 / NIH 8579) TaxID=1442370 RepID=A0A0D2F7S2_CLAB1|nr:uncharacterized protein Z519_01730 [Cladophialophora bantiana CBS 173.52]KIW98146.1 hypothetical protein Z519_01730 [Cladophialophora bantiana CBS 173.52]